ncbi:MAG TPA: hypothetical protein VEV17_27200 [Bryobacteraceae bacterium]|nr:hypothetical protein [Bryobacteraceae bacterium]
MSRLASLKSTTNLSELATLLQFKPAGLSFILYRQSDDKKYKTFEIPKRKGGKRTIKAPIDALKLVQRKLADLLQDCLDEINKADKRIMVFVHRERRWSADAPSTRCEIRSQLISFEPQCHPRPVINENAIW